MHARAPTHERARAAQRIAQELRAWSSINDVGLKMTHTYGTVPSWSICIIIASFARAHTHTHTYTHTHTHTHTGIGVATRQTVAEGRLGPQPVCTRGIQSAERDPAWSRPTPHHPLKPPATHVTCQLGIGHDVSPPPPRRAVSRPNQAGILY